MNPYKEKILTLLKRLSTSRGANFNIFSGGKATALQDFSQDFFSSQPRLEEDLIQLLFVGENGIDGLLQFLGRPMATEISESTVFALELVAEFFNLHNQNNHIVEFKVCLQDLETSWFQKAKLGALIKEERTKETALFLVNEIVELKAHQGLKASELLNDSVAEKAYDAWLDLGTDDEMDDDDEYWEERNDVPKIWADVPESVWEEEDEFAQLVGDLHVQGSMEVIHSAEALSDSDPLGLISNEDLARIIDDVERQRKKIMKRGGHSELFGSEGLKELGNKLGSVNVTDKDFNPYTFLVRVHQSTKWEDLNQASENLQDLLYDRDRDLKKLVTTHFDSFINCKNTIDDLNNMLDPKDPEKRTAISQIKACQERLEVVRQQAQKLYKPMLTKSNELNRIKGTLDVLRRFDHVFILPSEIKDNIRKRKYEHVIRCYRKARALEPADNKIIEHILKEVYTVIAEFRNLLLQKLKDSSVSVDEQERTVKYLIELNCEMEMKIDPAEYYLEQNFDNFLNALRNTTDQFRTMMRSEIEEDSMNYQAGRVYLQKKLIKRLCAVMYAKLCDFWKLCHYVISGKFHSTTNFNQLRHESKVEEYVTKIISYFCDLIRAEMLSEEYVHLDDEGHPAPSPGANDNIRHLLKFWNEILELSDSKTKNHLPYRYLEQLELLVQEVMSRVLSLTFQQSLRESGNLYKKETWMADRDVPGITILPDLFQRNVERALILCHNFGLPQSLQAGEGGNEWLITLVGAFVLNSFKFFADCLHALAFNEHMLEEEFGNRRLLAVFRNAKYTRETIRDRLWKRAKPLFSESGVILEKEFQEISQLYETLEKLLFDQYVRQKALKINRIIERAYLCGGVNWEFAPEPKQIGDHCLRFLLELVFVHEEVYTCSAIETKRVLQTLVIQLLDFFLESLNKIDNFSSGGALQILLEIEFINDTLKNYFTDEADKVFRNIQLFLRRKHRPNERELTMIREKREEARKRTCVMFGCFGGI